MSNIELLYSTSIPSYWVAVSVIPMIIFILLFTWWILGNDKKELKIIVPMIISLLFFTLCCYKAANTWTKEYWIRINENVTLNELYENYDVIKQKGDIWIVRDKE